MPTLTPYVEALLPLVPSSVSSLKAWYRSDSVESQSDGASLAQWDDSSGAGRHLTQSSSSLKPTVSKNVLNRRAAVRFQASGTGGSDYDRLEGSAALSALLGTNGVGTVAIVMRTDSDQSGTDVIVRDTNAKVSLHQAGTTVTARNVDSGGNDDASASAAFDAFHVVFWIHDGSNVKVAVDNPDSPTSAATGATTSLTGTLYVGSDGTDHFKGYVAELVIFNEALTAEQLRGLALYFSRKYRLPYSASAYSTWTALSPLGTPGVRSRRGIQGTGFTDRVASTGTLEFQLDNSSRAYSPDDKAAWRVGFDLGLDVRLRATYDNLDQTLWRGRVDTVEPTAGKDPQRVVVTCVDWMDEAAKAKMSGQAVVTDKRSDEIVTLLVAAVSKQPTSLSVSQGSDTYPYAFDAARDESVSVLTELQKVCVSELGYFYVKADGSASFDGRRKRVTSTTVAASFTGSTLTSMSLSRERSNVINNVKVQSHPRRKDTSNVVLFTLQQTPSIPRITSLTVVGTYRDPNQKAVRVGGTAMVTPVSTTDYTFNSASDGTGTDLTAQLTVTATFGGNSATVLVTNNGPFDGYLTKLQLRGKGLYDYETILSTSSDADSVAQYGEWEYSIDMPYQADTQVASDAAAFVVSQSKDPATKVESAEIKAVDDALTRHVIQREIGDRVTITESQSGVAADYFVHAVELMFTGGTVPRATWTLVPADPNVYWTLQVTGYTELDITTRLGYGSFVPKWVLDTSILATDTVVGA